MPLKKYLTVFFLSAFLSCGCVSTVSDPLFSNTGPIIDRKGVDLNLYAADLKQCNEYAAQVSVGRSVLKGAAAGAAASAAAVCPLTRTSRGARTAPPRLT